MGSFLDILGNVAQTGLNVLSGGAAGGILNLLGGGTSAAQDYEAALAERNREWQSNENKLDRQFQAEQQRLNFEREKNEWLRQFDLTNAYNTPAAQAERLKQANINPLSISEGVSSYASAPGFPSVSSAPSGGHGITPSSIGSSVVAGMFAQPERIASAYNALSQAGKTNIEARFTASHMLAEIDRQISEKGFTDIRAKREELEYDLRSKFGDAYENQRVKNATAEYEYVWSQIALNIKTGEKIDFEKLNIAEDTLLKTSQRYLNDEQATQIRELLAYQKSVLTAEVELKREQQKTEQTKQEENRASAAHHRASALNESVDARTKQLLQPHQERLAKITADIAANEYEVKKATTQIRIKQVAAELVHLGLANKELQEKINLLIKDEDWYELKAVVSAMESVSRSYMNTSIGTKVNQDNLRDWMKMPSQLMNGASSAASNMELIGLFM